MARILVTGGAGFIGSHTTRTFLDRGEEVFVFDTFPNCPSSEPSTFIENMEYRMKHLLRGAQMVRGNMRFREGLHRTLVRVQPEYIVHLAAPPNASAALHETGKAFDAIVLGTVNLLEASRDLKGLQKFVYVSSSMIYGDFKLVPVSEDAEKEPKEIYGGMKLATEVLVKVLCKRHGIPYAIVRPSAVYGPTNNNRSVLQLFVEGAIRGEPIPLRNPDATFLDFTYVKDLACGLMLVTLLTEAAGEEFNITRGEGRSLREAAQILRRFFPDLTVQISQEGDFRPNRGALDIVKARRLLGYDPQYSLESGLEEYVRFVKEHNRSLRSSVSIEVSKV